MELYYYLYLDIILIIVHNPFVFGGRYGPNYMSPDNKCNISVHLGK